MLMELELDTSLSLSGTLSRLILGIFLSIFHRNLQFIRRVYFVSHKNETAQAISQSFSSHCRGRSLNEPTPNEKYEMLSASFVVSLLCDCFLSIVRISQTFFSFLNLTFTFSTVDVIFKPTFGRLPLI